MAFNPTSGTSGSVSIAGSPYAFGKWRLSMKTNLPKVNNFTSAYQQLVAGLTSATITLDGPYDGGNMPLSAGQSYTFILRVSNALTFTVVALVGEIGPTQDIDDAARITVTAESSGTFTPSTT